MYLTDAERAALIKAADEKNSAVERLIARLRHANPAAFHTDRSLSARAFLIKPASGIPYLRFVRSPPETER